MVAAPASHLARPPVRAGTVAVLAHRGKTLDGGLGELRAVLAEVGYPDPIWYEVSKSRKAPKKARRALRAGARLVFVWGGDGMVQRCTDALAGSGVDVAILPAGTANLLASNLGIPKDLAEAVRVGLYGHRRTIDLGRVNGEHFAVMAGVGFDAAMVHDAGRQVKDRLGRLGYVWTGLRHVEDSACRTRIRVEGRTWFDGKASCVLFGNVGTVTGGIPVFEDAQPDDGWLEVGVTTATGAVQWIRLLSRIAAGHVERSPFAQTTRARAVEIRLGRRTVYELDGSEREPVSRLKVRVAPGAITVCVPHPSTGVDPLHIRTGGPH
jgi:diacylglycerol kinase (ATP)